MAPGLIRFLNQARGHFWVTRRLLQVRTRFDNQVDQRFFESGPKRSQTIFDVDLLIRTVR